MDPVLIDSSSTTNHANLPTQKNYLKERNINALMEKVQERLAIPVNPTELRDIPGNSIKTLESAVS